MDDHPTSGFCYRTLAVCPLSANDQSTCGQPVYERLNFVFPIPFSVCFGKPQPACCSIWNPDQAGVRRGGDENGLIGLWLCLQTFFVCQACVRFCALSPSRSQWHCHVHPPSHLSLFTADRLSTLCDAANTMPLCHTFEVQCLFERTAHMSYTSFLVHTLQASHKTTTNTKDFSVDQTKSLKRTSNHILKTNKTKLPTSPLPKTCARLHPPPARCAAAASAAPAFCPIPSAAAELTPRR